MTMLEDAALMGRDENGLAVVSTLRADATIQSSLVNAGVLSHPTTGEAVLAVVTYGRVKLANLRVRPQVTATFRSGWRWATVEGHAQIAAPDDPQSWLDAETSERLENQLRRVEGAAVPSRDSIMRSVRSGGSSPNTSAAKSATGPSTR